MISNKFLRGSDGCDDRSVYRINSVSQDYIQPGSAKVLAEAASDSCQVLQQVW